MNQTHSSDLVWAASHWVQPLDKYHSSPAINNRANSVTNHVTYGIVSVPPKPTPTRIAFSIAPHTGNDIRGRWGLGTRLHMWSPCSPLYAYVKELLHNATGSNFMYCPWIVSKQSWKHRCVVALYTSFMLTKRIFPTLFGRLTQPIGNRRLFSTGVYSRSQTLGQDSYLEIPQVNLESS